MNDDLDDVVLSLAGRSVAGAWDRVRRYCGLSWSGGVPETWAFRYFDLVDANPDRVEPTDVLAAAALHSGLSRADLAYFWDQAQSLNDWVGQLPCGVGLDQADEVMLSALAGLADWQDSPGLALLTKVLARKRPALIPLVDRALLDWYRPVTGERSAAAAWPALLQALRADLSRNGDDFERMSVALADETGTNVSPLRLLDIVIWMGGAR